MADTDFVGYLRVSTKRQHDSGAGIEAQRATIERFLRASGGRLRAEYVEADSGGNNERVELVKAIAACRRYGARLLVSKLDRLSRDAGFIHQLQSNGVRFVIAEMPEANDLTIGLLAVLAQHERKLISERTRSALAAIKARGTKLGGVRPGALPASARPKAIAASAVIRQARADDFARAFAPRLEELRAAGVTSLRAIAAALNAAGELTPRGKQWSAAGVRVLIHRIEQRGGHASAA